jgi:heme exporter protein C
LRCSNDLPPKREAEETRPLLAYHDPFISKLPQGRSIAGDGEHRYDKSMSETSATGRWADLANPTRFVALADRVIPWLAGLSAVVLVAGIYLGFTAPEDYQQGTTVRIMYIHVPFAWLAMMCYTIMALAALGTLVWRHPLADVSLKAAAPIGAVFTGLALVTGSIWGKPMWGTWWVWDARLTSVFILFLMYLGIIALTRAIDDPARAARAAAVITLVGFINIPIIKFSVDWWNTLHQPASVFRLDGPTIDPSLLLPLMVMALAMTLLFFTLYLTAIRTEILRRRVQAMRRIEARRAERKAG